LCFGRTVAALPNLDKMLDELKAALPGRALKHIEKSAKTKAASVSKSAVKTPAKQTTPAPNATNKSQLSLF